MKITKTKQFEKWYLKLKSEDTKFAIVDRMSRIKNGDFGKHKDLKQGLFELKFKIAGGLRIYYVFKNKDEIILLLNGGNKTTQKRDILKARLLKK